MSYNVNSLEKAGHTISTHLYNLGAAPRIDIDSEIRKHELIREQAAKARIIKRRNIQQQLRNNTAQTSVRRPRKIFRNIRAFGPEYTTSFTPFVSKIPGILWEKRKAEEIKLLGGDNKKFKQEVNPGILNKEYYFTEKI
eukprot:CAMPEP_0168331396 /NCGR_PEP_ID=MMETSP0213-20121227/8311_1 /TAXON_ID=151035 /ORGANISM="Euplotes harpa, Strain FSP1.4" /LENGTH=138 /DNA_ID=CAMNT_0008335169 /DNA_START=20 /DNA_END=434 /DNA_ORIENTATION=-